MIPLHLTLKNFLSYRDASIDFRGLHVACICGFNGAGKSSLLEAIAWALWGESRAALEDDAIHMGETEARVDYTFHCFDRVYRVIRTRVRGQSSSLEFQVQIGEGDFRSLTARGMRATQRLIVQHIRLDYDTFVNSAYLRQGHADAFMLKRPSERKQVLADLLNLHQYDDLAERAREQSRDLKAELDLLERSLRSMASQIEDGDALTPRLDALQADLDHLQQQQQGDADTLRQLTDTQQQRHTWVQHLQLQQQQQQRLSQDCQRLKQEHHQVIKQKVALEGVLRQAEAIAAGCAEYHSLQTEEDLLTRKFHAHQAATTQRQDLQQQLQQQQTALRHSQSRLQSQIETLQQQAEEHHQVLSKAADLEPALVQLHQARQHLSALDQRQMQAAPLLQRQQQLRTEIDRRQTRLAARRDELISAIQQLQQQQQRQPQIQQTITEVATAIKYLEERRAYQQQVLDKGLERKNFLERLQERQRECEAQLAELNQKIALLQQQGTEPHALASEVEPDEVNAAMMELAASGSSQSANPHTASLGQNLVSRPKKRPGKLGRGSAPTTEEAQPPTYARLSSSPFPPCPVCDRPLDAHHLQIVMARHQAQQRDLEEQIWVIREQLATSDREIQLLRQEYRDLDDELTHYTAIVERHGKLQEQLQGATAGNSRLVQAQQELAELERSLDTGDYVPEYQDELRLLEQTLRDLNYDDKNHALARGDVDRWRWADIKQAELKQSQRRYDRVMEQLPQLEAQQTELEHALRDLAASPLQQQITELDAHIGAIAYNLDHHTSLRHRLRQAQTWQLRQQELHHAQQQYPQLQQRQTDLAHLLEERQTALSALTAELEALVQQIQQVPDPDRAIATLNDQMHTRRTVLDDHLAAIGRLQQQQQQLESLRQQHREMTQQLSHTRRQLRVYQELGQAYGKNGIQALMIENVLPQLETEANQLLGRLTNHQLHLQFVTQRSRRRSGTARTTDKLIETLDILIADARGTRPYETYSGGEAFRINFAIRLALARLLAQRSGAALQLLVIDEGFGTQDDVGCDRLIAAIQAIANDFSCILTVTHVPRLKESFQHRIEITKTDEGSQVQLVM